MKILAVMGLGLVLAGPANAGNDNYVEHKITITGLSNGDARFIRIDGAVNDKYKFGNYYCVGDDNVVFDEYTDKHDSSSLYRQDVAVKLSICNDETLTDCQIIANDKYATYRDENGQIKIDGADLVVDVSDIKSAFHSCEPMPDDTYVDDDSDTDTDDYHKLFKKHLKK